MTDAGIIADPKHWKKGWHGGLPETPCGYGALIRQTARQRIWIPEGIDKYGIESIADIGCGDLNWISGVDLGCDYAGYDLVVRARGVKRFDVLKDPIPTADCLLVLWVINHLLPHQQRMVMEKIRTSGARYLIQTYDPRQEPCADVPYIESAVIRMAHPIAGPRFNMEIRLVKIKSSLDQR